MIAPLTRPGGISDELKQQARQADILHYLPGLRPWSRKDGGEYAGPCPVCGGKDRLHAWPNHPDYPRAWCRQCHGEKAQDAIAIVMWLGLAPGFTQAVALLTGQRGTLAPQRPAPPPAVPQPYRPPYAWQTITDRYWYWTKTPEGPRLAYIKERREPGYQGKRKTFYLCRPRPVVAKPDPGNPAHWYDGRGDVAQLWPYNWPAAEKLAAGAPLLWVDGEKDVKTAHAAGLCAVCGPDGGRSWQEEWGPLFLGRLALIVPDNDPDGQGEQQARRAAELIAPYASHVKIVRVPAGKDLTAWYQTLQGVSHAE